MLFLTIKKIKVMFLEKPKVTRKPVPEVPPITLLKKEKAPAIKDRISL
jgi:hypothetical protein